MQLVTLDLGQPPWLKSLLVKGYTFMACVNAKNNSNTCSQTLSYDKGHIWHSAMCAGRALWSLTRKTGNGKWDMAGWGQGNECIHHPWQAQVRTSDPVLPFGHTVLLFPGLPEAPASTLSRYRVRSDRQGQKIQTPRAPQTGSAGVGEGAQTKSQLRATCEVC